MQPARNRERGGRHGPDAVHRLNLVGGYSADDRPGDRPTDDLYERRVRDRRRRRRAGERLGSGRRDCRRGAPSARERGTGRLPEGDLRLQPRPGVCPGAFFRRRARTAPISRPERQPGFAPSSIGRSHMSGGSPTTSARRPTAADRWRTCRAGSPQGTTCDCSMFTRWAFAQAGIDIGLTTSTQWTANGLLPPGQTAQADSRCHARGWTRSSARGLPAGRPHLLRRG